MCYFLFLFFPNELGLWQMGGDTGRLEVGGCRYNTHVSWVFILPLLFLVVEKAVQRKYLKRKKINNYKGNSGTMECIIAFLYGSSHTTYLTAMGWWEERDLLPEERQESGVPDHSTVLYRRPAGSGFPLPQCPWLCFQGSLRKCVWTFIRQCTQLSKLKDFIEMGVPRMYSMLVKYSVEIKENIGLSISCIYLSLEHFYLLKFGIIVSNWAYISTLLARAWQGLSGLFPLLLGQNG